MTAPLPHGTRCTCAGQCLLHQGPCDRAHRRFSQDVDGKTREFFVQMTSQGAFCKQCWSVLAPKRNWRKADDGVQGKLFGGGK